MKLPVLYTVVVILLLKLNFPLPGPPTGEEIINQMHTTWKGKWGRNMRFDQTVYHYKNDSLVKEEVWQEILSSPKNLQIRFNGFESGNGIIFRNDSVFHFAEGKLVRSENRVHHLLLLGFDVFFLPPDETVRKLRDLGFDLNQTHERKIGNTACYVVGTANAKDEVSSQFWINKEKMYLEKVVLTSNGNTSEVEMKNYQIIDSYPVAMEIDFRSNGQLFMREKYFDVSFPQVVDPAVFDPENFHKLRW